MSMGHRRCMTRKTHSTPESGLGETGTCYRGRFLASKMEAWSAQRLDVKLRAAGKRPASSGAPLAAHPIMPVQVARRRANSRGGSRREKRGRTVNFNGELDGSICKPTTYRALERG